MQYASLYLISLVRQLVGKSEFEFEFEFECPWKWTSPGVYTVRYVLLIDMIGHVWILS